jgi:hypothetical protein
MPELYGIVGVATSIMIGLSLFSDLGLQQLVNARKRPWSRNYANAVWTLQIMRSWLISAFAILTAVALTLFSVKQFSDAHSATYTDPNLPVALASLAIAVLISGLEPTKLLFANKKLEFARPAVIEFGTQAIATAAFLISAWITPTIWAFCIAAICNATVRLVLITGYIPGPINSLSIKPRRLLTLFNRTRAYAGMSILGFAANNGDKMLAATICSANSLSQYIIAVTIYQAIREIILRIISKTHAQAFSEVIVSAPHNILCYYYKIRHPFDAIALVLCGALYLSAESLLSIIYDSRYFGAAVYLKLLSLGFYEVRLSVAGQLLLAQGMNRQINSIISMQVLAIAGAFVYSKIIGPSDIFLTLSCLSILTTIPVTLFIKHRANLIDWKIEVIRHTWLAVGIAIGATITFTLSK